MPTPRNDLAAAIALHDQKLERRLLAVMTLRQHELAADAAGVGRRESTMVRDAERVAEHAQNHLKCSQVDLALAIREVLSDEMIAALTEGAARSAAGVNG